MWKKDFLLHLSLENSADSYLYFRQALLYLVSYIFSSIDHLLCLFLCNWDEVLSINPFADVHNKDWLTYSDGTDRPGELCCSFSVSNDLTQMVNFPTWIPDFDSHSPALLNLFFSYDSSICSAMAFPPLRNSDHFVVSVCIDFLSNSKGMPRFSALLMAVLVLIGMVFVIMWEMFHGEDIFKLSASTVASKFREWVQVGVDVYIPHMKYQVKPHSTPSCFCCCHNSSKSLLSFIPTK